jgi:carotenoid cleavage dioxygenase-like enzyme
MQGELGTAKAPGKLRRYRIDLRAKTLREEIVDAGSHEFPMIDPRAALQKHAIGYLTFGGRTTINSGVKRIDYRSGATSVPMWRPASRCSPLGRAASTTRAG